MKTQKKIPSAELAVKLEILNGLEEFHRKLLKLYGETLTNDFITTDKTAGLYGEFCYSNQGFYWKNFDAIKPIEMLDVSDICCFAKNLRFLVDKIKKICADRKKFRETKPDLHSDFKTAMESLEKIDV